MPGPMTSNTCLKRASLWASVGALLCPPLAPAHDFWVQPATFWLEPQAPTSLTLQVGHGPLRQRSPIQLNRITRFDAITPNGTTLGLHDNLHPGSGPEDGYVRFSTAGAYVLVLETDRHAQSHLPAIRFNDYLMVEGLTPAIRERARTHRMDVDGSENYGRCAKSIVQVGPATVDSQAQVTRRLGLRLEIVPEHNPYAGALPARLPVRVFYEDLPLPGALVKLTNLEHDDAPLETHVTDGLGRASFTIPARSNWLLNVVWTKPLPASSETDFETLFSSLSFGFAGAYRSSPSQP